MVDYHPGTSIWPSWGWWVTIFGKVGDHPWDGRWPSTTVSTSSASIWASLTAILPESLLFPCCTSYVESKLKMRQRQPSLAEVEVGLSLAKAQKGGTLHMKSLSHVHTLVGTPHKISNIAVGRVGGYFWQTLGAGAAAAYGYHQENNTTSWLHLASWDLPDSQFSWESKMEPSVAIWEYISLNSTILSIPNTIEQYP